MNTLKLAELCDEILYSLLGKDELVERWWTIPNKAFNMSTPSEVNIYDVYKYLIQFCK